jgi:hypothetical protein
MSNRAGRRENPTPARMARKALHAAGAPALVLVWLVGGCFDESERAVATS